MSALDLCLQNVSTVVAIPDQDEFERWLKPVLRKHPGAMLTIRIVDEDESAALNLQYRHKKGPTNVLSFPADLPEEVDLPLLGDLVICAPLVATEAAAQNKAIEAHWAHLAIHGTLHLLGYDHLEDVEAEEMEALEIKLLASLGYPNPYADSGPGTEA